MQSDVLILLKARVDEAGASAVRAAIYKGARTATVSFNEIAGKVFLVRFDPEVDSPAGILQAARTVHADAVMAGG